MNLPRRFDASVIGVAVGADWEDALAEHPEWAMRNRDGSVQHNTEEPRLLKTCMFSSYMDEYVPEIMREINSLYDVDCFYNNCRSDHPDESGRQRTPETP